VGGYLTDRYGRRRVLVLSIFLYAFSACAAAFSTSPMMFLVLRCTTFMGVCIEFVAAVAWLAELFPNPRQREMVLGSTQVFSSFGGLLVAIVYGWIVQHATELPAILGGHSAWRYTLLSGVLPAIPLMLIRPFLPESPAWQRKKAAGTLKRPSFAELFRPSLRRTTLTTTVLFACGFGAAFGAIQLVPAQIVQTLPELRPHVERQQELKKQLEAALSQAQQPDGTAERTDRDQRIAQLRKQLDDAGKPIGRERSSVQKWQEVGGLTGRFLLAVLAMWVVSRRKLLWMFQLPGLVIIPLVLIYPATSDLGLLKWGIFLAGLFTIAQFSFWGNYLPRVYPVYLRGTGESFAANVGGRMIGTSAAVWATQLAPYMPGMSGHRLAYACAAVAFGVYLVGSIVTYWLPEPAREELHE
jgi:MFS family permease